AINPVKPTWFQLLQRKINMNQGLTMDDYITTGFIDVYYLGLLIKMTIEKNVTNRLFQVSSKDIGTLYDFSMAYANVFGLGKDRFSKGKWSFPINQTQSTTAVEEKLYFKLDTGNIEGFLNIELPSIEDSLRLTFNRFGGIPQTNKQKNSSGEGVKFI
ncbi:MAG: hypothetical protein NXH75_10290, partial [Halobacteriovoraceae bacterium]|nr:hypothetical protein [Halobacteriovoraceae bacterium]